MLKLQLLRAGLPTTDYDYGLHYTTLRLHYGAFGDYGVHYGLGVFSSLGAGEISMENLTQKLGKSCKNPVPN